MASNKVFGVSIIRLNGVDYRTRPGSKVKFGIPTKTPQPGSGIISGYSEEPTGAEITFSFNLLADTEVSAILNFVGNAEFVTDVGQTWVIPNAVITESPELSDGGDGLSGTLMGDPAVKV